MRTFEQRKAEIFFRSEQRIKERKRKRKRMILGCIPLFICIAVFSAGILPSIMDEPESETENMAYPYSGVEIENAQGDYYQRYDNIEDIMEISELLLSFGNDNDRAPGDMTNETDNNQPADENQEDSCNSYKIILSAVDGNQLIYILTDNVLVEESSQQEFILTDVQIRELLEALKLTE